MYKKLSWVVSLVILICLSACKKDENPPDNPMACSSDNGISTTNIGCCSSPTTISIYDENVANGFRTITSNSYPNHDFCFNPNIPVNPFDRNLRVSAEPMIAPTPTSILSNSGQPRRLFAVALNGVMLAPAPAQPFIFENPETGEFNWDWVFEPTNNQGNGQDLVGLDCASAHTGPQGYHYHGNMFEYVENLQVGISTTTTPPTTPLQIGWAADGFPILYRFGPDDTGALKLLQPSYQLKTGERLGDGITAPCGTYNGKYTNDYEFVNGVGDLDECNGIARNITLNTMNGEATFSYFYVITDEFPQIGRCLIGTPDPSFEN